jgi:DNA-binding NarL/FixJ family response regulator
MASARKIRLLIADDHPVMRYTLRSVLKQYPEIEVVGEATNGEDAVLSVEELQPEIVLMDINMPKLDGIAATRQIKGSYSRIAVLGLSVDGEGHAVGDMLRAGAVAVVAKERAIEDLYDAIQRAITSTFDSPARTVSLLEGDLRESLRKPKALPSQVLRCNDQGRFRP